MGKTKGLRTIMDSISPAEEIFAEAAAAGSCPEAEGVSRSDSIFSQLLSRIVQSGGIKMGAGADGQVSLEILLENYPDPLIALSRAGLVIDANPAFVASFGYSRADLIDAPLSRLFAEGEETRFVEAIGRLYGGTPTDDDEGVLELHAVKGDGTEVATDCLLTLVDEGERQIALALVRDFSIDKRLVQQLRESRDHYLALSETITEAIFRIDEDFRILFANSGVKNTFGYERDELVGRNLVRLFPEEVFRKHETEFRKYFFVDDRDRPTMGLKRTIELLGVTKNRGVAPMEISFGNSKDFRGRTLTCIVREISQRKTMERRLKHLAYHDKLTGLGNRDLFNEDMLALVHEMGKDPARKAAVLFLDLDGFKHINDTLGHDAGDELLVETARRIRVCLRDHDTAYRFGGDEFVAVLGGVREEGDATVVARRILTSIATPYVIGSGESRKANKVTVGVSIGIAIMPDHAVSIEEATKAADISMYCSKESGKNRFTLYDPSMSSRATAKWRIEQEMKAALGSGSSATSTSPSSTPRAGSAAWRPSSAGTASRARSSPPRPSSR